MMNESFSKISPLELKGVNEDQMIGTGFWFEMDGEGESITPYSFEAIIGYRPTGQGVDLDLSIFRENNIGWEAHRTKTDQELRKYLDKNQPSTPRNIYISHQARCNSIGEALTEILEQVPFMSVAPVENTKTTEPLTA